VIYSINQILIILNIIEAILNIGYFMPSFFKSAPTTPGPGEIFLRGFKYLKEDGTRNNSFVYKLFKHNKELTNFIETRANTLVQAAKQLANNENAIAEFIKKIDKIAVEVYSERVKHGKTYLKNKQTQKVDKIEALFIPIMIADIHRIGYSPNKFEKYLINGLNELKKFISENFGQDSLQIENCNGCIENIKNYQATEECIAYDHRFYQGANIENEMAKLGKEYPVSYPGYSAKQLR
jgi:hypothetical protein